MATIKAGDLDRRITVQRVTKNNTPSGLVETVSDLCTVWAARKDASDSEKSAAGTIMSVLMSRFTVRSTTATRGIRPSDKIIEKALTFDIVGIKELGRRDFLEITAQARLDRADG